MGTEYSAADGPGIKFAGEGFIKKPHVVYMIQETDSGTVITNEGPLNYEPGSYICYDEISGHVWPITEEYFNTHYEPAPDELLDDNEDDDDDEDDVVDA